LPEWGFTIIVYLLSNYRFSLAPLFADTKYVVISCGTYKVRCFAYYTLFGSNFAASLRQAATISGIVSSVLNVENQCLIAGMVLLIIEIS
jgi:hypothetical protein